MADKQEEYEYDESRTAHFDDKSSAYFLTGLVSLIVVPWTLYYIYSLRQSRKAHKKSEQFECKCAKCTDPTLAKKKVFFFFIIFFFFSFLCISFHTSFHFILFEQTIN